MHPPPPRTDHDRYVPPPPPVGTLVRSLAREGPPQASMRTASDEFTDEDCISCPGVSYKANGSRQEHAPVLSCKVPAEG